MDSRGEHLKAKAKLLQVLQSFESWSVDDLPEQVFKTYLTMYWVLHSPETWAAYLIFLCFLLADHTFELGCLLPVVA